ncbi:MAG: TlpA family protein disulfide reductase [Flavobacteriales bacterium]
MKHLIAFLCSIVMVTLSFSQTRVSVSGQFLNAPSDSVIIAKFTGKSYINFAGTKADKQGKFSLRANLPASDYYVLRVGELHVNIILRDSSDIKVYGDKKNLKDICNFVGSDESQAMNQFAVRMERWNMKKDSAYKAINAIPTTDTASRRKLNDYMTREYISYMSDRQQFVANNVNSAALIVALVSLDLTNEYDAWIAILNQVVNGFGQSPTVREYVNYANNVAKQKEEEKRQAENAAMFAPGNPAPDFEELMTDRKTNLKLSDLKGKYVLIDFWASWCGPCRKENPNVVKTYAKYKDDGFTIVSVSLDTDKQKWLGAIQADGLTWPNHVSDLGGWNSKVSKKYNVSSIPFTVLIDKEGNILQTNLRGTALENKLAEIFGH